MGELAVVRRLQLRLERLAPLLVDVGQALDLLELRLAQPVLPPHQQDVGRVGDRRLEELRLLRLALGLARALPRLLRALGVLEPRKHRVAVGARVAREPLGQRVHRRPERAHLRLGAPPLQPRSARAAAASRRRRRRGVAARAAARRRRREPAPRAPPPARSASACDAGLMCGANVAAPSASTRILGGVDVLLAPPRHLVDWLVERPLGAAAALAQARRAAPTSG